MCHLAWLPTACLLVMPHTLAGRPLKQGAIIRAMDDSLPGPPPGAGPLHALWFNLYQVLAVVLG